MRRLALAFVVGAAAGWLVRLAYESAEDASSPPPPSAARAVAERPVAVVPEAPRAPRVRAVPPADPAPAAGKAMKSKPRKPPEPAEPALSDAAVLALAGSEDKAERAQGVHVAAARGLLTVAQLLERCRSDADDSVRSIAFDLAVQRASDEDGTLVLVSAEILAWARDTDQHKRYAGIAHLSTTGARGAAIGRELLDEGGLPSWVYEQAVQTLVAARRFERLVPEGLDDESREYLTSALAGALESDPSIAPHVAAVLREAGPPSSPDSVHEYCRMAIRSGAATLAYDVAKAPSSPTSSRIAALSVLFDDEAQADAAMTIAAEIVTGTATRAGPRREILESLAWTLVERGAPGLAVLRRVADHDPNAWIRESAAETLQLATDLGHGDEDR